MKTIFETLFDKTIQHTTDILEDHGNKISPQQRKALEDICSTYIELLSEESDEVRRIAFPLPCGSGKTTTLYGCLAELNNVDTKIITTEDPVELQIDQLVNRLAF